MVMGTLTLAWYWFDPLPDVPVTTIVYVPLAVPGSSFGALPQPRAAKKTARRAKARNALPRNLRRGRNSRTRQARLAPPPAANKPAGRKSLLLNGCAGVVLTVKETLPLPVMELGLTKQADSVRLAGMVHVRLMGVV